ncbi:MAG TPA: ABC transporter ATP-binding protein [Candidatus Binatia bacterium]|nr:ABC transporter ATP-binding protein [Candidatus Binatia bacterium]
MSTMLDVWNLAKEFPAKDGPALIVDRFDLKVTEGEFVCVIGHSGCGKSTVLSILMGLSQATRGTVILGNKELDGPGCDRGVVFQSAALLPWMSVLENVQLAVAQVSADKTATERRRLARHYLALVGLEDIGDARPADLSAGMRQRVGIARAFATDPRLLLLDEPFSLLDAITRLDLQDQLAELCDRTRKTVVMVTHDVDEALLLADRIVMMTSGPAARVGDVLDVPFPRPRDRSLVLSQPAYYQARDRILSFLESPGRTRPSLVHSQAGRAAAHEPSNGAAASFPAQDAPA